MPISRRDLLRLSIAAGAASSLGLVTEKRTPKTPAATPGYLDAAVRAARWIRTARIETPEGYVWLSGPERPEGFDITPNLYTGSAGIVLFLLELARAIGDKVHREEAVAGADALIASLPEKIRLDQEESGLYTGVAGIGFTLGQVFKETGDEKYRKAAIRCRDLIHAAAQPTGKGVEWGTVTDIIGGASGTGLYLLHVARMMDDSASRDLAVKAGLRLIELGIPEAGGRKWRMDPTAERLMPNFSHGTAGVAYYLATLHRETGRQEFLDAALAGARYLQSIATTEGDTCLIFHDEPDNKKLYYLGWCHGPVGTSRLWIRLDQIDGKAGWLNWAKKGAKSILASGIPEHQTPRFLEQPRPMLWLRRSRRLLPRPRKAHRRCCLYKLRPPSHEEPSRTRHRYSRWRLEVGARRAPGEAGVCLRADGLHARGSGDWDVAASDGCGSEGTGVGGQVAGVAVHIK